MVLSDIRKQAREALSGKWKNAVLITLVYSLFEFVLGYIGQLLGNATVLSYIFRIVSIIISIPIAYGLIISFMKLKKGEEVKCYDFLTSGFSNFTRSWKLVGNMLLKLWLPILLYILAIIVLSFAISFGIISVYLAESSAVTVIASIIGIIVLFAAFVYLFVFLQ